MKAIASALLALSVLTGVAATTARADQADRIGTQDWWQQQDRNRKLVANRQARRAPAVELGLIALSAFCKGVSRSRRRPRP
jgi:hypothetical protein